MHKNATSYTLHRSFFVIKFLLADNALKGFGVVVGDMQEIHFFSNDYELLES